MLVVSACHHIDDQIEDVSHSAAGTPMRWIAANSSSGAWQNHVEEAIERYGAALLSVTPRDIEEWCPSFAEQDKEERKAFWAYLMSSLMKYESNYDPSVTYLEPFRDANGKRVVSRGLLQLSKESSNGYGCGIVDPQELHNPKTNLVCAVRIMNRWIERDKAIQFKTSANKWHGLARYWSPFRNVQKRRVMQSQIRNSSYCS